jgi:hypothetical protein
MNLYTDPDNSRSAFAENTAVVVAPARTATSLRGLLLAGLLPLLGLVLIGTGG